MDPTRGGRARTSGSVIGARSSAMSSGSGARAKPSRREPRVRRDARHDRGDGFVKERARELEASHGPTYHCIENVIAWLQVMKSNEVTVAVQVANVEPCDCAFLVNVQLAPLGNAATSKWHDLPPVALS